MSVSATARVLFVASEIFPLAKTGGLGDVSAALPAALIKLGADVRLLMPAYRGVLRQVPDARLIADIDDLAGFGRVRVLLGSAPGSGVPLYLVVSVPLYGRPGEPYHDEAGDIWPDNDERFALLCHAALAIARSNDGASDPWQPDIMHCNDWHTALVPALVNAQRGDGPAGAAPPVRTLLTIHNAAYQGPVSAQQLHEFGLSTSADSSAQGDTSFLALGIQHANRLTTVSPTYAKELQTREFGCGLETLIAARAADFTGILNGVDYSVWDPSHDAALPAAYDALDPQGKAACKRALLQELGLSDDMETPLLAVVSRLTAQKGLDMLVEASGDLLAKAVNLVVLGSGDAGLEAAFRALAADHPAQVAVRLEYDERLAHLIMAGADIFLMPSRFEPCGLNQMYALRYATVPVIHAVGGLADTIVDADDESVEAGSGTGFVFRRPSANDFMSAIARALLMRENTPAWRRLQSNGQAQDFGWEKAARQYLGIYRELIAR
ncbi:MAG: glycogen synthase GlgA [Candidatus Eremiobacter antarcticus]|nr:glycogen synthase GlgA [Candidatus Eremiobacteraeota bacterium]MBC5807378.1 glycogen synthase GlgA [Candidatus Eremiobacteraeota bacterium]PZR63130.1 MAG: glycogen synthase GlgA [Candidatus Eremiobacter sp. RRmetagenome_bin22]